MLFNLIRTLFPKSGKKFQSFCETIHISLLPKCGLLWSITLFFNVTYYCILTQIGFTITWFSAMFLLLSPPFKELFLLQIVIKSYMGLYLVSILVTFLVFNIRRFKIYVYNRMTLLSFLKKFTDIIYSRLSPIFYSILSDTMEVEKLNPMSTTPDKGLSIFSDVERTNRTDKGQSLEGDIEGEYMYPPENNFFGAFDEDSSQINRDFDFFQTYFSEDDENGEDGENFPWKSQEKQKKQDVPPKNSKIKKKEKKS